MRKIIALIPVYNNERTITSVVTRTQAFLPDLIVVNDGSTDTTGACLAAIPDIDIVEFPDNKGKGSALMAGFRRARERGFTHVLTLDADDQHDPALIPPFLTRWEERPEALWIGARIGESCGVAAPIKNKLGRSFGNFWIRLYTGADLSDTQSGFRIYPLAWMDDQTFSTQHYDFEQEVLIKAAQKNVPLCECAIPEYYQDLPNRVSHFLPVRDTLRVTRLHVRIMCVRIKEYASLSQFAGKTKREKVMSLLRHELTAHVSPSRAALAVAVGVFFGILPIHGFQVFTLILLTFIFKLNRPLAFIGVNVSSLPLLPFLIIFATKIGALVLPESLIQNTGAGWFILHGGIQFIVGSLILAPIGAALGFLISYPFFLSLKAGLRKKRQKKENQQSCEQQTDPSLKEPQ